MAILWYRQNQVDRRLRPLSQYELFETCVQHVTAARMIRLVFAVTEPIPLYRIVMENGDSTAEEHSCDRMTDDPEFDDQSRYIRRARRPSIYLFSLGTHCKLIYII